MSRLIDYSLVEKKRLDIFLADEIEGATRSAVKKMIENGDILVNGNIVKAGYMLSLDDNISIKEVQAREISLTPENIEIDIVYEDEDIAVINKQQGLTVHPSETMPSGTLVNALLYRLKDLSGINGEIRPGIVHRIDKNTSGLLVVAKNDNAHLSLSRQLEDKTCHREYIALVHGNLKDDSGRIDAPIARSKGDRKKMAVVIGGRRAVTDYEVIERFKNYTLTRFKLQTGRTHQIRVHSKYIGHPIVGDDVYSNSKNSFHLNGQLLHAYRLEFIHPSSNRLVSFTADIPEYFQNVLNTLKNTLLNL